VLGALIEEETGMQTEIFKCVFLIYGRGSSAAVEAWVPMDEYTAHQGPDTALFEKEHSVAWERIVEWQRMQGLQQCSAQNKRGQRCKCLVAGRRFSSPNAWDAADKAGGYCFAHSGEAPNVANERRP
jgi:hypothetical protein